MKCGEPKATIPNREIDLAEGLEGPGLEDLGQPVRKLQNSGNPRLGGLAASGKVRIKYVVAARNLICGSQLCRVMLPVPLQGK
jgi:hypothetical protein